MMEIDVKNDVNGRENEAETLAGEGVLQILSSVWSVGFDDCMYVQVLASMGWMDVQDVRCSTRVAILQYAQRCSTVLYQMDGDDGHIRARSYMNLELCLLIVHMWPEFGDLTI